MSKPRRRAQRPASAARARAPGGASSSSTSRPGRRRSAATWSRTKTPRPGAAASGPMSEMTSARIRRRGYADFCCNHVWRCHTTPPRVRPPTTDGRHDMLYRLMGRLHAAALTAPRDAGQGTVEYVGLLLLVGALIASIVAGIKSGHWNLAKSVVAKLKAAIDTVAGAQGGS